MNERYTLVKIDDYLFQIHDKDTDMYMVAEEIHERMNKQEELIQALKEINHNLGEALTIERKNDKNDDDLRNLIMTLEDLNLEKDRLLLETKTEKEKRLEEELRECERFRHSVFKRMGGIN